MHAILVVLLVAFHMPVLLHVGCQVVDVHYHPALYPSHVVVRHDSDLQDNQVEDPTNSTSIFKIKHLQHFIV
jgi:hypothetical protein